MIWALVLLVALAIPLAAVVLDSPVLRAMMDRRRGVTGGDEVPLPSDVRALAVKVEALERELETANHDIAQLKESQQFFQRLLEDPAVRQAAAKPPKQP